MKEKFKIKKYQNKEKNYQNKVNTIATIRMLIFIIMLISFITSYYNNPFLWKSIFIISLIIFIILVFIHDKYYKIYNYYTKYLTIAKTYLDRESGAWKHFEDKGEDFLEENNYFLKDLDIIGDYSLFQYLSICKTLGGRRKLLKSLSNIKQSEENLKNNQQAIQELTTKPSFIIDFQIALSAYDKKEIDLSKDFTNLKTPLPDHKMDLIIGIISSIIGFILLGLSFLNPQLKSFWYGIFFFNFIIATLYHYILQEEFQNIEKILRSYNGLNQLFSTIEKEDFTSKKLYQIKNRVQERKEQIKQLKRIDELNSLKNNFLSNFILNGLCCINLILLYQFSKLINQDNKSLQKSIQDIEELEALLSLATIGIMKQNICLPTLSNKVEINFQNLKHPLLEEVQCVGNDFHTNPGVHIITGSNMAGKTSFLRTIGINLILMNAGTYTCATQFQASYFKIFTSMRVEDNMEKKISTFYGELLRIKDAMDYLGKENMLVLIDEIFKGTNYQDRIYGARKVIEQLNHPQTITFITTHDFELCEEKNVSNYYVKEYYEKDQIIFDYKIRKGKSNSTNARYLMKKLGIIEQE